MQSLRDLNRFLWSALHQADQSALLDKIEAGEITESEAEAMDDLSNFMQSAGLRIYDTDVYLN